MIAEFRRLMTHEFDIIKHDRNVTGNLSEVERYTKVKGFIENKGVITISKSGEQTRASATVFFGNTAPITKEMEEEHWFIKQTKPVVGKEYRVLQVEELADPRTGKIHHYEVLTR